MLVAAVLRPEEREDGELEMVRVAAEELPDSIRFPVGETEGAVQRLLDGLRQAMQSSLPSRCESCAALTLALVAPFAAGWRRTVAALRADAGRLVASRSGRAVPAAVH